MKYDGTPATNKERDQLSGLLDQYYNVFLPDNANWATQRQIRIHEGEIRDTVFISLYVAQVTNVPNLVKTVTMCAVEGVVVCTCGCTSAAKVARGTVRRNKNLGEVPLSSRLKHDT